MVKGLDIFRIYFERYSDSYIIIGGTACDIIIDEAGFQPRVTKDIDIILVVEALSTEFVKQFWQFIRDGRYQQREKSRDAREYYRFLKPEKKEFPYQIELFSRAPDVIVPAEDAYLTPIPVGDDLSSLSAILLNDDYYRFLISHSQVEEGLHYANVEALICLKAKAFLEIRERMEQGSKEDSRQLKKHKSDIFRLSLMLTPDSAFELPEIIQAHINQFAELIATDLPDKAIFKEMGIGGNIDPEKVFAVFKKSFNVKEG